MRVFVFSNFWISSLHVLCAFISFYLFIFLFLVDFCYLLKRWNAQIFVHFHFQIYIFAQNWYSTWFHKDIILFQLEKSTAHQETYKASTKLNKQKRKKKTNGRDIECMWLSEYVSMRVYEMEWERRDEREIWGKRNIYIHKKVFNVTNEIPVLHSNGALWCSLLSTESAHTSNKYAHTHTNTPNTKSPD